MTRPPRFRPGGWICDRFQWRAAQVTRAEDLRKAVSEGFGYLTLDPSPRLRRMRLEAGAQAARYGPLPPLPEAAYTPEGALMEPQDWPPAPNFSRE